MASSIQDLHPDVLMLTLLRMDGPTLAAIGAACSGLRSAASDEDIWQHLCLSTWPSLRHLPFVPSYRSFFADAFFFPSSSAPDIDIIPDKLISAVDLYHRGAHVLSKVVESDTSSAQFRGSPFRIGFLDSEEDTTQAPLSVTSPEELTLSWALIDPATQRAVRVSSQWPVAVERQWCTGEKLVRFAMVIGNQRQVATACVMVGEEKGELREVVLTVVDEHGISVKGKGGLVILKRAMEGKRRMWEEDEVHRRYVMHVTMKEERKQWKIWRERMLDLCSSAAMIAVLVAFSLFAALR